MIALELITDMGEKKLKPSLVGLRTKSKGEGRKERITPFTNYYKYKSQNKTVNNVGLDIDT